MELRCKKVRTWTTLNNSRRLRKIGKVFVPSVGPGSLGDDTTMTMVAIRAILVICGVKYLLYYTIHTIHYGHNRGLVVLVGNTVSTQRSGSDLKKMINYFKTDSRYSMDI